VKVYRGRRGKAPFVLNLGSRWRLVVNSMPLPLCAWERTAVGPRTGLDVSEKRKIFYTYRDANPGLSSS